MNELVDIETERPTASKKLRITLSVIGEMGHLIPMSHIADALQQAGHEVYFITMNDAYNDHKASKTLNAIGCKNIIFTDDGITRDDLFAPMKGCEVPSEKHEQKFGEMVCEEIVKIKPDVVITDYNSRGAFDGAKQVGCPVIINLPGLFKFMEDIGLTGALNIANGSMCCGVLCIGQSCAIGLQSCMMKYMMPDVNKQFGHYNKHILLINSFVGLDDATSLPPNYIFTGPLSPSQSDLIQRLQEKDPELYDWLEKAHAQNEKVVYISLGSIAKWQDWSVKAMFNGLKKVGCKVIWGIKGHELPEKNDKFWVREWVPQIEILAHPAVKTGMSHCGFGGTLEFIAAGLPIVTWPHFEDQPPNSTMLEKRKVAVTLYNPGKREGLQTDFDTVCTYATPVFDEKKVYDVFTEVLNNEIYSQNMKKQQALALANKGREIAVKTVENAGNLGTSHLISQEAIEKYDKTNCFFTCCCWIITLGILAALVYFTTLHFTGATN